MNILVDIIHPAHVHFFRNAIAEWENRGFHVAVTAREKDVTIELLNHYEIPHTTLSKVGNGRLGLLKELIMRDYRLWMFCRTFKPDVLTGISGIFIAHVGFLMGKPSIVWDDTEHQKQAHTITWPFATKIFSPDCYSSFPIKKQYFYPGCHDLAYLHPKYFTPDADLVRSLGINPDEKYCIIRFVGWGAHHDVGHHGFAENRKLELVRAISQYAIPYITSEKKLPKELEPYRLSMPPQYFHHVLAFASLCITESPTVATEGNVLGVPAIHVTTLKCGVVEMFKKYGLIQQTTNTTQAINLTLAALNDSHLAEKSLKARENFLEAKVDITQYIVDIVEKSVLTGKR